MIVREVIIGNCRLIYGDSRAIVPTLGRIEALVSDPPFGMEFRSNHRVVKHKDIANDESEECLLWACSLQVSHSSYIFMRWDNLPSVPKPRSLVTWVKNNHSMGDLDHEHARQTEVCAFYPGPEHYWPNYRPTDVIFAPRTGNVFHPTEKPVQLMSAVVGWTHGTVIDPFMGSGSTGCACVNLGRDFIGIEIDEGHFETAVRRITDAHKQADFFVDKPAPVKMEQKQLL